jgi:hemerythrin superfamily protein
MYENHAAREDTVVFPAWKDLITENEYDELGEKFEDIEHDQFGDDGYEDAVKQISEIESSLGLSDISIFTPAAPAKV